MKLSGLILVVLFFVSGTLYYVFVDDSVDFITADVVKVVDGDTVDLSDGQRVRLLGVNAPESSMENYDESKDFLVDFILNESVGLEIYGFEKYGRILGYIFFDGENVNQRILSEGLGSLYYYEKDDYYDEMVLAEDFARLNGLGIWKRSSDYGCIELVGLKFDEPERLILRNVCNEDISIVFKDDATHIYREVISAGSNFEKGFSHIWNDGGDSLYVWDSEGLLVFHRY